MTLGELAAYVCAHLSANGISCVLSGGACVTIYSNNPYQSYDLDFVDQTYAPRDRIRALMAELGFAEEHRYFKHGDTDFFVEFIPGPLSVGSEPVRDIVARDFETGTLRLLSATDCIKDRLAAYYHWDDLQALEQARMVAAKHEIDLEEIRRWSKVENKSVKFENIKNELENPLR
jgi:hypothetical protein